MKRRLAGVGALGLLLIAAGFCALALWQQQVLRARAVQAHLTRLVAAQAEVENAIAADLALRGAWLATDPASASYVADALADASADVASISDLIEERRVQLGLDAVGVIDVAGNWVAGTRPWQDSGGKPAGHALYLAAREGRRAARGLVREQERLFLGVIEPMLRGGEVVAYVYAGRRIDGAFLARIAALADGELALVDDGMRARVWVRSGERDEQDWLAALAKADGAIARLPLLAATDGALLLAAPARAQGIERLPLLVVAAGFAALWWTLLAVCWHELLEPIDSALGLLERAASGERHLRAPAWLNGARGRFAIAFDGLMQRHRER
ncbi:MAG: hypothetical protein IT479_09010 [Xanthomonadales bacterium]|nr:hypothetical protein [Xanthomonadales bacterium]MCC6593402.1 hypothetical protein [Xanthomonadales bacterium]MCE7930588.1 hypothetical protein [Xanthomonadales bacterium PRO6]